MTFPVRLLALPAGALLSAALVGLQVGPSDGGAQHPERVRPLVATAGPVAADAACSPGPLRTIGEARQRGVSVDLLRGGDLATRLAAVGDRAVVLGPGRAELQDFRAGRARVDSAVLGPRSAGLVGEGSGRTTVALRPRSSTRASAVPTTEYEVNPLNVLRVTGAHPRVGGFTLTGSEQGHTYNGLRIDRAVDGRVADVRVRAVPGDMNRPPGETFGINDFRSRGSVYEHVEVDGAGVGAAGFGVNKSEDVTLCDVSSHDNAISMGFAFWSVKDLTLIDCVATGNDYTGFNFERVSGRVRLVRPRAEGNRWDMRVVSDLGSAQYTIVDPDLSHTQVPGRWTVAVPSIYWQHPSLQKRSDITLIVHGKPRNDLLRFVRQY